MNSLYLRLAATNIKSNKQFYTPYLLTGMLTVAMFYTMIALSNNTGMDGMPGASNLRIILNLGTIIIGLFAAIFLFYTNSFIIKRRKKEIGIYNILGMEKKHLGRVLLVETLFTALMAVGLGLVIGIVFNKLLLMFLYKLTGFNISIQFQISFDAIRISCILFGIIYLCTLIYNLMQIKLSKPVELLHGGNVGEKEPKTKIIMTIIGILSLGTGYYISFVTKSPIDALNLFFVAVLLVIIGTYCLFTAGSIALLKMLRKNKNFYYKPRHFTAVSGMICRMKQNAVGLANICILSTMVLVMVSTCVSMYVGVDDAMKTRYPAEIAVQASYTDKMTGEEELLDRIHEDVAEGGREITNEYSFLSFYLTMMGDNGCARLVVESRAENYGDFFSTYGSLLFLGLFLGTMFLMITVLIIFYKQISEGYDDKERFQILEKVGMSNTEVKRTISSQIRIVFFLPILAAAIHVLAAFPMICRLMLILNLTNTELFIWCLLGTVAVFGIIYLIVFRITSKNYYRIVKT